MSHQSKYYNDYLTSEDNIAIQRQKLREDLSCKPLPEGGTGYGPTADQPPDDYYGEAPPGTPGIDAAPEGDDDEETEASKSQRKDFSHFKAGYDHGYAGKKPQNNTMYYAAGHREGSEHAAAGKPHYFNPKAE